MYIWYIDMVYEINIYISYIYIHTYTYGKQTVSGSEHDLQMVDFPYLVYLAW